MMTYYHQLDPYLIHFFGNWGIRWYSLAYIFGVIVAYFAGYYLVRKGRISVNPSKISDIIFFGAIGAVVGGRLGYCAFYNTDLFLSFDPAFPYWGALKVYQGGMSSHGGIIGLLLSQILYSYRHKLNVFSLMDWATVAGSVGIFFGRIANFINGELYGRVVEGSTWLAVRFPTELYLWAYQPDLYKKQLLSLKTLLPSLSSVSTSTAKIPTASVWEEWVSKAVNGDLVYEGYISYVCRLIVQNSGQAEIRAVLEPLLFLRYPSQLYQALLGGLATFLIVCIFWLKARKAGLVSLVWISSYLIFRIITEFYRQPDPQTGFQFFQLSQGQWLSICLFLIVALYGYFIYKSQPIGFKRAN